MLGGTAYIQDEQMAIYAGNSNVQYRASGGYRRENTAFPGDFGYRKLCGRIHIALSTPNEKGKAIITTSYINERNILPPTDLSAFATTAPNSPSMYTDDGLLNWEDNTFDNPMGNLYRPYKATTSNMTATAALSYEILPGLLLKANIGGGIMQMEETQINPWNSFNLSSYDYDTSGGFSYFADGTIENWIAEPQISYQRRIGKGQLTVLIGTTLQQEIRSQKAFFASGYSSNSQLGNIEDAAEIDPLGRSYYQYRYGALFGRINYNLNGQYILNLTARRDGSSRFGSERRIANFGAIGAGWIFSKSGWAQTLAPILSFGKLRASYGITGNDQIADYAYSSTFTSSSADVPILLEYDGRRGRLPVRLSDPFYGWEQSKKAEIGLELGFINDKVIFATSFYLNRSSNQLVSHGVPLQTGFPTLLSNFPAVVENKGIELELNTINIKRANFSWTTAFNVSCPSNKLFSFSNIKNTSYNNFLVVGKPLDIIKGFHYEGVNSTTGTYQFTGVYKDSISFTAPSYTKTKGVLCYGGFSNSLQYKGWQVDILFQFVKQNQYNYMFINQPPGIAQSNQPVEVWERWQKFGDKGNIQKFTQGITETYKAYMNALRSDEAIQDASYIRLKSVNLGYQLSNSWTQRIHLQNARLYLQGQNLLTFTRYKGRDPEVAADRDIYPPLRLWVAGFQFNF
jgi:TonB-linked SusC/RagA family outer membrane protein